MSQFDKDKVTVCIDSSCPVFTKRLIKLMASSGVRAKEFTLPKRKGELLGWAWNLWRSEAKIIHYLWGTDHPLIYIIPKLLGKKVIIHWIGSDVMHAASDKGSAFQTLLQKIAYKMVDSHLADFEPSVEELKSLGIEAKVVPLMPDMPLLQEDITWPVEDRVFVYLPETRQEFYGSEIIFRLAEEMPDINFLITRHSGEGTPQLPNIKYLGWVEDIETVWRQVKVYLRLTKHDGLSHTVIEALARGKHVIWSYEFPHCHRAQTFEEARDTLRNILRQNQPNIKGMNCVRSQFEPSKIAERLRQGYLSVFKGKHTSSQNLSVSSREDPIDSGKS